MLKLRSVVLNGYVEVAESVGLSPYPLMRVCGIDPGEYAEPTGWLSAQSVDDLFELSAEQSGHADIGLRMSTNRGLANLGLVGLIAREEPDVRSAIDIILRHRNLHNEAVSLVLSESGGMATFTVESAAGIILGRQSIELVVASVYRILEDLLSGDWLPAACYFTHEAPEDLARHHQVLGPTITFGRKFDGLIIPSSDLDAPNPLANPSLRPFAQEYLELLSPAADTTTALQVRDLIAALLPTEGCSAARIARSLGMDRRTLHRRLAQSDESYSSILNAVRAEQALKAIGGGVGSFTALSVELGFSELSAFSRWFRRQFGVSPKAWVAANPR